MSDVPAPGTGATAKQRRPEPVVSATQVSAAAVWAAGMLVAFLSRHGILVPDESSEPLTGLIEVTIVATVGAAGSLLAGFWARRRVTPLEDPRDEDGVPLHRPAEDTDAVARALLEQTLAMLDALDQEPGDDVDPEPAPPVDEEPATAPIRVPAAEPPSRPDPAPHSFVDIAALRREYGLD